MVIPDTEKETKNLGDNEDESKLLFGDRGSHCLDAWEGSHSSCSLPAIIQNQTTSKVTRAALLTKLKPTSKPFHLFINIVVTRIIPFVTAAVHNSK